MRVRVPPSAFIGIPNLEIPNGEVRATQATTFSAVARAQMTLFR